MPAADYDPIFAAAGREWNVDPALLKAMAAQESSGNPRAVSKANAQGLMQIIPATQKALGVTDPNDPVQSIFGGAKYMAEALDAEKTPEDALRYYHGGPNWRMAYGPESKGYAPAVTAHYLKAAGSSPQPPSTATGSSPVASAPIDPDQAAGEALVRSLAPGSASNSGAPAQSDPDEAAGMELVKSLATPKTAAPTEAPAPNGAVESKGGIARNAAAGVLDASGNVVNALSDPIGNMIGKPLATAAVFAHDAIAPYLGGKRFPDDVRNMLLGDNVPQPGNRLISGIGQAVGVDPAAVTADTTAERLTRKGVGGAVTTAALGPGGLAAPVMGAAGAVTGDIAAGRPDVPEWAKPAAELAGNVAGATAGAVAGRVGQTMAGTGGGVAAETAQLAQLARDRYGIPISAPRMSDSSVLRIANDQSSNLPFSGAGRSEATAQTAWQRAVSRTFGEDAPLVNSDVMSRAATRIGQTFDGVAQRTTIHADPAFMTDLARIETDATQTLPANELGPIKQQLENLLDVAGKGNGDISGQSYQALTRANSPLGRAQQASDPNVRFYARQVRSALDDAFQRSAAPQDQAALAEARGQWRAMKTVEDLVEKSPDGNLSPALLMGQVRSASSKFDGSTSGIAYTGGGDLGDLARIGQRFLKTPPNSGTADRMIVNSLLGGGAVSAAVAQPWSMVGIPAGLIANRLGGAYLRGGGLANRLIASSINGPRPVPNPLVSGVLSDMDAGRQRNRLAGQ